MNIIIDGSNLLHRTYWVAKSSKKLNKDTSDLKGYCVHIFLKALRSYVEKFLPNNMYIVWDRKIKHPSTNFRKLLLEGTYKGNRDYSSAEDIFDQAEKVEELITSLGIPNLYPYVLEGDDVIGWLCNEISPNIIISLDKDFLQLVDANTSLYLPNKKLLINIKNFEDKIGIPMNAFLYYEAVIGDPSDNIPGFPGYGKVRGKRLAIQLAENNGNLKALNLSKEYYHIYEKNIAIMNLKGGYKVEQGEIEHYHKQFNESKDINPDFNKFKELCEEYGLYDIKRNISEWEALFTFNKNPNIFELLDK